MKLIGVVGPRSTVFRYMKIALLHDDLYKFRVITLDKKEPVTKLKNCDMVINFASYTDVGSADNNRFLCWKDNVDLPLQLVDMCQLHNIPFIHMSTLAIQIFNFDNSRKRITYDQGWSYYAFTKLLGEQVLMASSYTNWAIIRTDTIFGKNGDRKDQKFVGKMMRLHSTGERPMLINIKGIRPTYAKHVAQYILTYIDYVLMGFVSLDREVLQACNSIEIDEVVTLRNYYAEICKLTGHTDKHSYKVVPKLSLGENYINSGLPHWKDALKEYIENEC